MQYLIRESNLDDKDSIQDFNTELSNHGYNFKLPIYDSKSSNQNDFIFEQRYILTEEKNIVRAGYTLKHQWFKVNDDLLQIGYYYNPITAGLFNRKYNICGILLLNDANKKNPNLFSLGMGGYSEALPKLLHGLKWNLEKIPFFFKIFHPYIFLKNIKYLKNNKLRSFIIMFFAKSGLGWLTIKILFLIHSLFYFRLNKKKSIDVKEINIFDESFNEIWENTKEYNSFIAVRNYMYLKKLYPDERFIKLKFLNGDKIVGWSIALCTKLKNHKQFGDMLLGSIVDCLCLKGYETSIIDKTSKILKNRKVDLIVSNQSHVFWKNALKENGFIQGVSNFIFASSKTLNDKLVSYNKNKNYMHITRGDGDGPINL